MSDKLYDIVVMGTSAGGMNALSKIFTGLHKDFPLPIVVVQHLHPNQNQFFVEFYGQNSKLPISEAIDKEPIKSGHIYFAPPDYHLLIEDKNTFSLSDNQKINYSRPSIDVLFESAGEVFEERVISVILTGANNDGAVGSKLIKYNGGFTIAQDPADAEHSFMPNSAIQLGVIDSILKAEDIPKILMQLVG